MKRDINVVYVEVLCLVFSIMLVWNFIYYKNIYDLVTVVLIVVYYLRIKIYNFKKYH